MCCLCFYYWNTKTLQAIWWYTNFPETAPLNGVPFKKCWIIRTYEIAASISCEIAGRIINEPAGVAHEFLWSGWHCDSASTTAIGGLIKQPTLFETLCLLGTYFDIVCIDEQYRHHVMHLQTALPAHLVDWLQRIEIQRMLRTTISLLVLLRLDIANNNAR